MTSCVFAFGQGEDWFFETPSKWKWGTLPAAIRDRIPNVGENSAGTNKIAHIHDLVFGAKGSYMLTWKARNGLNYQVNNGLPADLANWLNQKDSKGFLTRNVANIRLALGPDNKSYFVTDGRNYLWNNLPSGLNTAIEKLRKKGGGWTSAPRIVALGFNGDFIMITAGGGGSWCVKQHYPALDANIQKLLAANGGKGGAFDNIATLSLDVHDGGNYVMTTKNGGYDATVPDTAIDALNEVLKTLPSTASTSRGGLQRGSRSSGLSSILKIANLALNAERVAIGASGGGYGGGGGGIDFGQANNMLFTAGLQDSTWSSVDSAASMPIQ